MCRTCVDRFETVRLEPLDRNPSPLELKGPSGVDIYLSTKVSREREGERHETDRGGEIEVESEKV